jgi:hypothetical protein
LPPGGRNKRKLLQKPPWALEHFLDFLNSTNLAWFGDSNLLRKLWKYLGAFLRYIWRSTYFVLRFWNF